VLAITCVACAADSVAGPPRELHVRSNPYAAVDWQADLRLKVQLHDHVGVDTAGLRAYDRAGYDAMSLMHYSGAPNLSYAWTARRWPPAQWLPAGFLTSLEHIREFIPNAEEVGEAHVTSPFLTEYISRVGGPIVLPAGNLYTTTQGCIDAIRRHGGLAFVAHPWVSLAELLSLADYNGIEIYSAFAKYKDDVVRDSIGMTEGRTHMLLANWDALLVRNPQVLGIAVNDHYGPNARVPDLPSTIRDSGKILVFAPDTTGAALRAALENGRFFAVADLGSVKDRYPEVRSIEVSDSTISIDTNESVRWIWSGTLAAEGARLPLRTLPIKATYVRAEIRNQEGSTVYTQAFALEAR
jgi:hypothetical protein